MGGAVVAGSLEAAASGSGLGLSLGRPGKSADGVAGSVFVVATSREFAVAVLGAPLLEGFVGGSPEDSIVLDFVLAALAASASIVVPVASVAPGVSAVGEPAGFACAPADLVAPAAASAAEGLSVAFALELSFVEASVAAC